MDETDIDPNYKRPTHIDELGLNHAPIYISAALIDKINRTTDKGTKDFHKAYEIIADHLEETGRGPRELIFWFRKASEINSNEDGAPANAAIRGGSTEAAELDSRLFTPDYEQKISNVIGEKVIDRVLKGSIPNHNTITQDDALKTVNKIAEKNNQPPDLSNWVGSAWSWNIPVTFKGVTQTIGAHISSNPESLERFKKVQAAAGYAGIGKVNTPGEFAELLQTRYDPIMGPPEHIRADIQNRIQTLWRREAPKDGFEYFDDDAFDPPKPDLKYTKDFIKPSSEDKETPRTPEKLNSINESDKLLAKKKIETHAHGPEEPAIKDVFEQYADVMGNKYKADEVKPLPAIATKAGVPLSPLLSASKALPQKGPERVDTDPAYNPFNRDKNGFEDLEGEVYIWKKDEKRKDQLIREAGREKDFGLDIDYDTDGHPLPKKGPERVKSDPDYNPFDVALNGEEDLEGEAYIWKTDEKKKNRLIRLAGRSEEFGFGGFEEVSSLIYMTPSLNLFRTSFIQAAYLPKPANQIIHKKQNISSRSVLFYCN